MKTYRVATIALAAVCVTPDGSSRTGVAAAFSPSPSRGGGGGACRVADGGGSTSDGHAPLVAAASAAARRTLGRSSDRRQPSRKCRDTDSRRGTALRVSAPIDVYSAPTDSPRVYDGYAGGVEEFEPTLPSYSSDFPAEIEIRTKATKAIGSDDGPDDDGNAKRRRRKKKPTTTTTTILRPRGRSGVVGGGRIESTMPTQQLQASGKRGGKKKRSESIKLSREEEAQLSDDIRALRSATLARDDLKEVVVDPSEGVWAEACGLTVPELRRVLSDGQEARTRLVAANVGLVVNIAKRYTHSLKQSGTILTLQDMVQEGNLGLMEAAERFEPARGFRFSTYASYWVKQRILRSIADSSRVIRLPAHVHSKLNTMRKAQKEMEKELGRPPTMTELAHRLDMPLDKLQLYTDSSRTVLSLEVPLHGNAAVDDRRTLGDRIASKSPTPADDAEIDSLRRDIRTVMEGLADRERDVLVARFGLNGTSPLSTEQTSKRLGISRDRVRTVEARALNKLRHPRRNYKLKEYVGGDDGAPEQETEPSPESLWSF